MASLLRTFERSLRRVARESVGQRRFSRQSIAGLSEGRRRMILTGAIRSTIGEAGDLPSQGDIVRLFRRDIGRVPESDVRGIARILRAEEVSTAAQLGRDPDEPIGPDAAVETPGKFRRRFVDRVEVTFDTPPPGLERIQLLSISTDETLSPREIEEAMRRRVEELYGIDPGNIRRTRFAGRFTGEPLPF